MDLLKVVGLDALVKPADGLMVRDWSEDVVQLVQFPRTHTIVSLSPYSLKLETWLRMAGIKYRVSTLAKSSLEKSWLAFSTECQQPVDHGILQGSGAVRGAERPAVGGQQYDH